MLFESAERPPPVFMTQSIHILKREGRAHTHTQAHRPARTHRRTRMVPARGSYNGLDLTITGARVGASGVATGSSTGRARGNAEKHELSAETCRDETEDKSPEINTATQRRKISLCGEKKGREMRLNVCVCVCVCVCVQMWVSGFVFLRLFSVSWSLACVFLLLIDETN